MKVLLSETARLELEDAFVYLELEFEGLGYRFRQEVKGALLRISRHPTAWPIELADIRKCLLHKFPYKILYSIEPDHIIVVPVAHQHRRPDYWTDRLD